MDKQKKLKDYREQVQFNFARADTMESQVKFHDLFLILDTLIDTQDRLNNLEKKHAELGEEYERLKKSHRELRMAHRMTNSYYYD